MGAENSGLEAFDSLDEPVQAPEVAANTDDAKKASKKEEAAKRQRIFIQSVKDDPTFAQRHCIWSNSLQVVHSLGYTDKGNIVRNGKTKDSKGDLGNTGAIIGYEILNTGEQAIPYNTEEYTKDDTGVWVGTPVQKTLEPGQTVCLTRKYTALLCSVTEISFQLANGIIMSGSGTPKDPADMDKFLSSYYFKFNDSKYKVNSSEIKINVGQKVKDENGADVWEVKPEYETQFGYLNNPEKPKAGKRKGDKLSANTQDVASAYVRHLMEEMGSM